MNFCQITTLTLLLLLALVQVNAKGYKCYKYIVIKHGDRCKHIYGYDEKKDYYVRYKDLITINPSK